MTLSENATPQEVAEVDRLFRDVRLCHLAMQAWKDGFAAGAAGTDAANPYLPAYDRAVAAYEEYRRRLAP